jgi:hypothetical protein
MAEPLPAAGNPERLELDELTRLQPGLARLMPEISNRFWRAAYAARAGNWPLAAWQLREMNKLFRFGTVTRPKYTHDIEAFIHDEVQPLVAAIDAADLVAFEAALAESVDAINEYHRRWDKGFIVWKLPESAPPDLDLTPR